MEFNPNTVFRGVIMSFNLYKDVITVITFKANNHTSNTETIYQTEISRFTHNSVELFTILAESSSDRKIRY